MHGGILRGHGGCGGGGRDWEDVGRSGSGSRVAYLRIDGQLRGGSDGDGWICHGLAAHWNGSIGRGLRGHDSRLHSERILCEVDVVRVVRVVRVAAAGKDGQGEEYCGCVCGKS